MHCHQSTFGSPWSRRNVHVLQKGRSTLPPHSNSQTRPSLWTKLQLSPAEKGHRFYRRFFINALPWSCKPANPTRPRATLSGRSRCLKRRWEKTHFPYTLASATWHLGVHFKYGVKPTPRRVISGPLPISLTRRWVQTIHKPALRSSSRGLSKSNFPLPVVFATPFSISKNREAQIASARPTRAASHYASARVARTSLWGGQFNVQTIMASNCRCLPIYRHFAAQLTDQTQAPNTAKVGIAKALQDETGAGRGDANTWNSSIFIIQRDPFRSIRRGRQLFQRKFTHMQGQGANDGDGVGDLNTNGALGAGLADSCALCHGRPRGSAGAGGNVATRPDSRDAPHLFGLGLKEMLADEITSDLRNIRQQAITQAAKTGKPATLPLHSKGIRYGSITASPSGSVDISQVQGVDADLRVKPFFAEGSTISMREFIVGALHKDMGLEVNDTDMAAASAGQKVTTPTGMVLDGTQDKISPPPAPDAETGQYELDPAIVDHLEFYLLNYFKPGLGQQNTTTAQGRSIFNKIGCSSCHVSD